MKLLKFEEKMVVDKNYRRRMIRICNPNVNSSIVLVIVADPKYIRIITCWIGSVYNICRNDSVRGFDCSMVEVMKSPSIFIYFGVISHLKISFF